MSACAIYEFEVEGQGYFPFDMLRRDRCWPAREGADTSNLVPDSFQALHGQRRVIRLRGLYWPNEARWKSFGWTVLDGTKRVS